MKANFDVCVTKLLQDEGGYSNDPDDNGGPTNFGITLKDYRLYINPKGTANDVKNMKVADAKAIYREKYWNALGCDDLSSGVDYTVFDYGVNSGLGRPRKALQRFKDESGTFLIGAINNERTGFLQALAASQEHDQKYLKGWLARVKRVDAYSRVLASKDNTSGPASGAGTLGIGAAISQYWHNHESLIIISTLILAALIGTGVHLYRNRNATSPTS